MTPVHRYLTHTAHTSGCARGNEDYSGTFATHIPTMGYFEYAASSVASSGSTRMLESSVRNPLVKAVFSGLAWISCLDSGVATILRGEIGVYCRLTVGNIRLLLMVIVDVVSLQCA